MRLHDCERLRCAVGPDGVPFPKDEKGATSYPEACCWDYSRGIFITREGARTFKPKDEGAAPDV